LTQNAKSSTTDFAKNLPCGEQKDGDKSYLVTIVSQESPPRRFIAGADALGVAEQKMRDLQQQIDACRDLSTSLAFASVGTGGYQELGGTE
jgi:hypothetical protein